MRIERRDNREEVGKVWKEEIENERIVDIDNIMNGGIEIERIIEENEVREVWLRKFKEIGNRLSVGMRKEVEMKKLMKMEKNENIMVVKDENIDRRIMMDWWRNLMDKNMDRGIEWNIDKKRIRMWNMKEKRRRKKIENGEKEEGSKKKVRMLKEEELRRKNMVMEKIGGDIGVEVNGKLIKKIDGILRNDEVFVRSIGKRIEREKKVDMKKKLGKWMNVRIEVERKKMEEDIIKKMREIEDDRKIEKKVIVDRRRIDIDMNFIGIRRERVEEEGDEVVEKRKEEKNEIEIMNGNVGLIGEVNEKNKEKVIEGGGIGEKKNKSGGDREIDDIEKIKKKKGRRGEGIDKEEERINERIYGIGEKKERIGNRIGIEVEKWKVNCERWSLRRSIDEIGEMNIIRNIEEEGEGKEGGWEMERLMKEERKVVEVI